MSAGRPARSALRERVDAHAAQHAERDGQRDGVMRQEASLHHERRNASASQTRQTITVWRDTSTCPHAAAGAVDDRHHHEQQRQQGPGDDGAAERRTGRRRRPRDTRRCRSRTASNGGRQRADDSQPHAGSGQQDGRDSGEQRGHGEDRSATPHPDQHADRRDARSGLDGEQQAGAQQRADPHGATRTDRGTMPPGSRAARAPAEGPPSAPSSRRPARAGTRP